MSIDRARLLIRIANQIADSEDRQTLLAWADEILVGAQVTGDTDKSQQLSFPISVFRRYKGRLYQGQLLQGWRIQLNGKVYPSPSNAAFHVSGHSENGLRVWRYIEESTGEEQPIKKLKSNR